MSFRLLSSLVLAVWAVFLSLTSAAHAGTLGVAQVITGDADSGIGGVGTVYTHAVNMGGGAVMINGVSFAAGGTSGTGYTTVNFPNAITGNFTEFPNPGDAVATMLDPFRYGATVTPQTVTISGLTPGQMYDARIYYREWVGPFNRTHDIRFDEDGAGALGETALGVNLDADTDAHYLSYQFEAVGINPLAITFTASGGNTTGTFHLSGFTVQEVAAVPEPASLALWSLLGGGACVAGWVFRRRQAK